MKKLMIMLVALTVGVVANAASLVWGAGVSNDQHASGEAQAGSVYNLIFLGSNDFSGDLAGLTYDTTTGLLGTGTGSGFTAKAGQELVGSHTLTADEATNWAFQETFERADSAGGVNGNYLMVMFDSATPEYYWANQYTVSGISDLTTAGNIYDDTWTVGTSMTHAVTTSGGGIPEPTSGLLLLVGGAMLALRRKRA